MDAHFERVGILFLKDVVRLRLPQSELYKQYKDGGIVYLDKEGTPLKYVDFPDVDEPLMASQSRKKEDSLEIDARNYRPI